MSANDSGLWREAVNLVTRSKLGILTTVDAAGRPHATWMGFTCNDALDEVLAISGPVTHKIANLEVNPHGEWMITSADNEAVIYLSGPVEVYADEPEKWVYWKRIPDKSQAHFLRYYDEAGGFAVVRMQVERVELVRPLQFEKVNLKKPAGD